MNSGIERFVAWFSTPRTIFSLALSLHRSVDLFSFWRLLFPCLPSSFFSAVSLIVNWNAKYKIHLNCLPFLLRKKRATRCANKLHTIWYIIENCSAGFFLFIFARMFPVSFQIDSSIRFEYILNAVELNETKLLFFLAHWMLKFTWMNIHLVSLQSLYPSLASI